MFLGTYEPRLDDKGRLILPARFREELAEGLVITKGHERCLYVWPVAEFERVAEQLGRAPVASGTARDVLRVFYAGAADAIPDKQGRVLVPQPLRDYAGLDRDNRACVVLGGNTRVELWAAAAWHEYLAEHERSFARLSEEVPPGLS